MIIATVFHKNDKIVGVQLEGHAEYGRRGKDIVCSAVSILYINLVNSLESFTDDVMELNGSKKINFQNVILKNMPSKEAELLFQQVWIHTFAICVLVAGKVCQLSMEDISRMLSVEFQGTLMLIKSGTFHVIPVNQQKEK